MIETDRLILRHPRCADAQAYLNICNSEFVLRFNAMTPQTIEKVKKQFSQSCEDTWVLEHRLTGQLIGTVFTEEDSIRWGVNSVEVSYFLAEEFSNQGYMKEALHALIAHLFNNRKLTCVAARSFAPNTASRKLLESLGFHQDGYIPHCVRGYNNVVFDDTLYSVFKEDWK